MKTTQGRPPLVPTRFRQLIVDLLFKVKVQITRPQLKRLSKQFVTPFTPFVLSNWYISNEIDRCGLRFLNFSSERLTKKNIGDVMPGQVVYVQVDQLDSFETIFPQLGSKILLLTGKWNLPGLEDSEVVQRILASDKIASWWSQNQIFADLPIKLFPYGLNLFTLPRLEKQIVASKQEGVVARKLSSVPFARVHNHLFGYALSVRRDLEPYMDEPLSQDEYFKEMAMHRFVISPRGDRPDTYRHYESISLGSIPVTDLPIVFKEIFGESVVNVESLVEVAKSPNTLLEYLDKAVDPTILEVGTWETKIRAKA
jgi:hypothetical protein